MSYFLGEEVVLVKRGFPGTQIVMQSSRELARLLKVTSFELQTGSGSRKGLGFFSSSQRPDQF
jgi:hypothetical protein